MKVTVNSLYTHLNKFSELWPQVEDMNTPKKTGHYIKHITDILDSIITNKI